MKAFFPKLNTIPMVLSGLLLLVTLSVAQARPITIDGCGRANGTATLTPGETNAVHAEISLRGNASHLGIVRIKASGDGVWENGRFVQPTPATVTVTMGNGDTLVGTFAYGLKVYPGRYDISGPLVITSGTGRFRGYTGRAEYRGSVNVITREVTNSTFTFSLRK